jgi:hypothetical protein
VLHQAEVSSKQHSLTLLPRPWPWFSPELLVLLPLLLVPCQTGLMDASGSHLVSQALALLQLPHSICLHTHRIACVLQLLLAGQAGRINAGPARQAQLAVCVAPRVKQQRHAYIGICSSSSSNEYVEAEYTTMN